MAKLCITPQPSDWRSPAVLEVNALGPSLFWSDGLCSKRHDHPLALSAVPVPFHLTFSWYPAPLPPLYSRLKNLSTLQPASLCHIHTSPQSEMRSGRKPRKDRRSRYLRGCLSTSGPAGLVRRPSSICHPLTWIQPLAAPFVIGPAESKADQASLDIR